MKTFFIWMIAGLSVCMNLPAQRGGGGGGGGGNFGGGGSPSQSQSSIRDYDQVSITDFPDITGLSVKQNLSLFKIVKDEYKNVLKLNDQKQALQTKINNSKNQKDIDKITKDMAKLDEKIQKEYLNADKKVKVTLSNDQYREFREKKDLIKFNTPPTLRGGGGSRPNRPDNSGQ